MTAVNTCPCYSRSNKAGAAGDEDFHYLASRYIYRCSKDIAVLVRILYTTASTLSFMNKNMKRSNFSFQVQMELQNVLYLSYLVPVSQVRQLVPKILPLNVIGKDKVFVSLVLLRCVKAGLPYLPFPRFTYNQINIRTYVRDPDSGRNGVYFISSGISSTFISYLAGAFNLMWQRINVEYDFLRDNFNRKRHLSSTGMWCGDFIIDARCTDDEIQKIPPFTDNVQAFNYLVQPLSGFYGQQDNVRKISIRHPEVCPQAVQVQEVSFPLLNTLEIVDENTTGRPDTAFVVPEAYFHIDLPPQKVTPIW